MKKYGDELNFTKILLNSARIEQIRREYVDAMNKGTNASHEFVVFSPDIPDGNKMYILTKTTKWEYEFIGKGRILLINLEDDKKFRQKVEDYCTKLFGKGTFNYYK